MAPPAPLCWIKIEIRQKNYKSKIYCIVWEEGEDGVLGINWI